MAENDSWDPVAGMDPAVVRETGPEELSALVDKIIQDVDISLIGADALQAVLMINKLDAAAKVVNGNPSRQAESQSNRLLEKRQAILDRLEKAFDRDKWEAG